MKDRYIGETVRFDVMEFSQRKYSWFIDFHKAFDTLEWSFLIVAWNPFVLVQTLFAGLRHCTIIFKVVLLITALQQITLLWKGVSDKVILSLHICLWLRLKLLQSQFLQNTEIRGIRIGEDETKLLQYADDTTAVLSDTD